MKILLVTVGSRGDIQPFVTIGACLKASGHDVHLATDAGISEMIAEAGLSHHVLPLNYRDILSDPAHETALSTLSGKVKAQRASAQLMRDQFSAIWRIGLEVAPDLILFHLKSVVVPYLARHLNVPAWPVMLQPGFVPTRAYPQFMFSNRSLGAYGNLATHRAFSGGVSLVTKRMIKAWVQEAGHDIGAPMDAASGFGANGPALRLHAYSSTLMPVAADMPITDIQVGYPFSAPVDYKADSDLRAFLKRGEKPFYIGFGSMPGRHAKRFADAISRALNKTGRRALISKGWGGFDGDAMDADTHVIGDVPHSWLFPQVAAVLHHGGAGTTHEGLRNGCPSLICPMFGDQHFFGRRAAELGAGPLQLATKRVTADRLALSLEYALIPKVVARAQRCRRAMEYEDGAGAISKIVEQFGSISKGNTRKAAVQ